VLVRFLKDERGGSWRKGDKAWIVRTLAAKPQAQDDIYLVAKVKGQRNPWEMIVGDNLYWCVGSDIEPFNQLAIF